jgi:TIGR03009 family protein
MTRPRFVWSLLLVPVSCVAAYAQAVAQSGQPLTPIGGPAVAPAPQAPIPPIPQQPEWAARMSLDEQKWIDDVLRYWEARSDKVKLFECRFQRWDYDGGFVDADGKRQPRTYAEGSIKYAQPDKGLYHVKKLISLMPPAKPGDKPQAIEQNAELGEHWVCDGMKVFAFEANKKQVSVTPLPSEMRGKAIADGPLPFLFGAKAETIKARYWIRGLPSAPDDKSKENKYWLEAVPKGRQDAQNFKMVRIVLDKEAFLPESLEIFAPNFDPPRNDARQTYVFANREANDDAKIADMVQRGLDPLKLFHRDFFDVRVPLGWKKVEQNEVDSVPLGPSAPQPAAAPQRPRTSIPR